MVTQFSTLTFKTPQKNILKFTNIFLLSSVQTLSSSLYPPFISMKNKHPNLPTNKMPAICFPLYTPSTSIVNNTLTSKPNSKNLPYHHYHRRSLACKAKADSPSSILNFDLYDLLGIDSSSDQSQIKTAYRSLQKRCHPDIAGPTGHDMAIILNEAYSVLSDPGSRLAYDKVSCLFLLHMLQINLLGFGCKS